MYLVHAYSPPGHTPATGWQFSSPERYLSLIEVRRIETLERILFFKFVGTRKTKIMGRGVCYSFIQSFILFVNKYLSSTELGAKYSRRYCHRTQKRQLLLSYRLKREMLEQCMFISESSMCSKDHTQSKGWQNNEIIRQWMVGGGRCFTLM